MKQVKIDYSPLLVSRYGDHYFENRYSNNPQRIAQFKLDVAYIKKFIKGGVVCDVGCSTGEFLNFMSWTEKYGMEINEKVIKEAKKNRIKFDKNIFTENEFFDVVIFRGTIQHVDEPFRMMKMAYNSLKKNGVIVFLATPNSDSILYRLKLDLPFLSPKINFYIPGKKSLCNSLVNLGFKIESVEYPYWKTPYRNFFKDHFFFLLNIFSKKFYKHSFWGSSMSIIARK